MATKTRRRIDGNAEQEIRRKAGEGWSAVQIERDLDKRFDLPDIRTIQRIVREERPADPSAPWTLASFDGNPAILRVLAAVIVRTEGRVRLITNGEAQWVSRVATAAPDLSDWATYVLARAYRTRELGSVSVARLDAALAFAPWRSEEASARYDTAVHEGWIEHAGYLIAVLKGTGLDADPDALAAYPQLADVYEKGSQWAHEMRMKAKDDPAWMVQGRRDATGKIVFPEDES